ncbi:Ribosomal protein S18 acetylase RimI [Ruegeria halocynthiae]|uniref:Ribosomal protein S18 acetylase RimI n=1 Tax=Ruegeria halocynthiae TaxID=985054 RepID=A0A1H3F4C3_9RHOB|nr:GNAT family N-acetyltransferase [Ruegeria halocynthiae]SDX85034.1 Ribosomal protein S18 acetylase RimI [Ruegeria halocynthiae]
MISLVKQRVTVKTAETPAEIGAVQDMMRALVDWLFVRHHTYHDLVARYFDPDEFESELSDLPGIYGAPAGTLLIASVDLKFAGCVGLREIDKDACEMKRMFVDPKFHGQGVGQVLATHLIHHARELGYARMYLDTGPEQFEACGLYQKLGFQPIKPYYNVSDEMADWLTFMVLQLDPQ